jgi:hypothetical protein
MSDHSHVAAHDAARAEAAPPGGDTPRFVRATVDAVDEQHYLLTVKLKDDSKKPGVSYNPLAYIPRRNDQVWLAALGQNPQEDWWVMGVASRSLFGTTDIGRTPSAALRRDSGLDIPKTEETRVPMTQVDWDTDKMVSLQDGKTIRITPRRTGLYTIKAGGRWDIDTGGRRIMDLRWVGDENESPRTDVVIARDEKAANDQGQCGHSVSVDVMITDASHSTSARIRRLSDQPSVELVMFQTSGDKLLLRPDVFLQMTYQGPKP